MNRRSLAGSPRRRVAPRSFATVLCLLAGATALAPRGAAAHARWFAGDGPFQAVEWDRLNSLPVMLALTSGAATVAALMAGQRLTGDPLWPRPPVFQRLEPSVAAILGVQTAIAMIFAASRLNLFVPNIELPHNALGVLIAGVVVVAAFSFITGVLTRVGAAVTVGLFLLAFAVAPWYEALEQVIFVGIAFYLAAVGRGVVRYDGGADADRGPLTDRMLPYALPTLRIAAGLSVLVLGFTEKLINVDLGMAFLEAYPHFNVAREAGITWFTDERFVYAIGIAEATAGIALLCGCLTRVVILALWIPFNLGIAFLPAEELIGHLPILSTMYVLLVRGTEGIPPPAPGTSQANVAEPTQRPSTAVTA